MNKMAEVKEHEQLYMFEFLIYQLNLPSEKFEKIKSQLLSIHLNFLDFGKFVISQEEFFKNPVKDNAINFGSGESCVFSKRPRDLMNRVRTEPLIIEVHKSNSDPCPMEREPPICKATLQLTGCLCQIEMAMKEPSKLPEPYTVRATHDLIDEGDKPSGTIELFLRLSCLGESIVTHFHVNNESFLFKNMNSVDEFSCVKLPPNEEDMKNKFWTPKSKMIDPHKRPDAKTIVGISSVCDDLVKADPRRTAPKLPAKPVEEPIENPSELLQIDQDQKMIADHHFRSKSKMIDPDKQPDAQTIVGISSDRDDVVEADPRPFSPKLPAKTSEERIENASELLQVDRDRMIADQSFDAKRFLSPRKFPCGGKVCSGGLCGGSRLRQEDVLLENRWKNTYRSSTEVGRRLRGGNDDRCPTIPIKSMQALLPTLRTSFSPEEGTSPSCCGCTGKPENRGMAKRKPCYGIDCLIRSFREAEKFVDGIGRVPGMAGLGLMDPTESPYFGRYRPRPQKLTDKRLNQNPPLTKSNSILRRPRKFPIPPLEPNKSSTTGFRKSKKDELKDGKFDDQFLTIKEPEVGPCGEPICKSRKVINEDGAELPPKESSKLAKSKRTTLLSGKRKHGHLNVRKVKNLRNYERNYYGHVKVGKRVMKMVEAGSQRGCFGHRSCVEIRARVPGNMGWLWNTNNMPGRIRPRIGWKPGAISRHLWRILEQAKIGKDEEIEERPVTPIKGKKGKLTKSKSLLSVTRNQRKRRESEDERELPPTLHIHRKNGDYYVTMYPVKSENFNQPELQEEVKPIQFKVTKDKNGDANSLLSSSIGDDMEIEFSPPGALQKYKKMPERIDLETQVVQQEILDAFKGTVNPTGKKKKGGKK